MNHFLSILLLISTTHLATAQEFASDQAMDPTTSNFEPSLFIVIGVLSVVFFLTFSLILYAKFCYNGGHQSSSIHNVDNLPTIFGPNTRFSGIERSVVEALPFFRFASLNGSKHGLMCSVCLAEFEETEILRLLPKCKHGFHIECIDQWLERHSSCPLCRQRVSHEDLTAYINLSSSMRLFGGGKVEEAEEDMGSSVFELVVERESHIYNDHDHQQEDEGEKSTQIDKELCHEKKGIDKSWHRVNHQIVISDVVFKNRWSNVSSSDLMFLNSEMLGITSSERFSSIKCHDKKDDDNDDREMSSSLSSRRREGRMMMVGDKRALSEITAISRVKEDLMGVKNKIRQCLKGTNDDVNDDCGEIKEDIKRKLWFPIARKTVEWFANRERNTSQQQQEEEITEPATLDV